MKGHFNILPHEVNKKACPSRPGLWTKGKNMSPEIQSKFTGFELHTLQDIEKLKTRTLEKSGPGCFVSRSSWQKWNQNFSGEA